MKSRMFPFITKTWNPLGGHCIHECEGCWAQKKIIDWRMEKYQGIPHLIESELTKRFSKEDFVFVQDMTDLFANNVPQDAILKVLDFCHESESKFLLLTKNPRRYRIFEKELNHIDGFVGVTLETNRDYPNGSLAPLRSERFESFINLECMPYKFVSIEPIRDFDLEEFANWIFNVPNLDSVAIGYDNYSNHLPEPSLEKTNQLIAKLETAHIKVYRKTIREGVYKLKTETQT